MGRRSGRSWAVGSVLLAACARSAITDAPTLDWDGEPAVALDAGNSALDGAEADDGAVPGDDAAIVADDGGEDAGDVDAEADAGEDADTTEPDAGDASAAPDASAKPDASVPDASAPADAGVDAGPPACPTNTERCGTDCVDTQSESAHCGRCDNVCGGTQICTDGACVAPPITVTNCTAKSYGGHSYQFCTGRSDDWVDARKQCISLDLDLAVPDDQAELDFMKSNNGGQTMWIGVSDRDSEGNYRAVRFGSANSTQGSTVGFKPWASGEPNNTKTCAILGLICSGDEDCMQMRNSDGLWNDNKCSDTIAYACESY
jgi:hypothetical protein